MLSSLAELNPTYLWEVKHKHPHSELPERGKYTDWLSMVLEAGTPCPLWLNYTFGEVRYKHPHSELLDRRK